jgi:hypothetical protein
LEQALWNELGLRLGPENVLDRPAREVEEYLMILALEGRKRQADQRRQEAELRSARARMGTR